LFDRDDKGGFRQIYPIFTEPDGDRFFDVIEKQELAGGLKFKDTKFKYHNFGHRGTNHHIAVTLGVGEGKGSGYYKIRLCHVTVKDTIITEYTT